MNQNRISSHGIIHVDDMGDIDEFRMTDITGISYSEEQMSKTDMENTLGVRCCSWC